MKKISTLFIAIVMVHFNLNAQFVCTSPQTISSGTHTITEIIGGQIPPVPNCADNFGLATGARWFLYTATVDGMASVSSDIPANGNLDTRVLVFTGTCSSLVCLEGNDDIDGPTVKTSEVFFPVSNGVSYYITWDNTYSTSGFDFTLTETAVSCPTGTFPINEDFDDFNFFTACYTTESVDANNTDFEQEFIDWDGDSTDEDYVTNGSTSNIAKDDWLFSGAINLVSGYEYTVDFKYNGANGTFAANENLDVYFVDDTSSGANVLTSLFSETGITRNGNITEAETMAYTQSVSYTSTATGTYYLAFNGTSAANTGSLLLFEFSITEDTLGSEEFTANSIRSNYNSETDMITLNSEIAPFTKLEVFNILGQNVLNKRLYTRSEQTSLANLVDGIYIVKILTTKGSKTIKIVKH